MLIERSDFADWKSALPLTFWTVSHATIYFGSRSVDVHIAPQKASWILVLRWFVLGLTPFVIGLAIVAWNRRWWKTPARIHYSLIVAALLAFLAFVYP